MWRAVLVGLGGFAGSVARYWLAGRVQSFTSSFPTGTLAVNVSGSFVLGLVLTLSLERAIIGPDLRLFLTVGFCAGFTTMSTFSYETVILLQQGLVGMAMWNVATNVIVCLVAVWGGALAGRLV
jgi:CrcB protein